MNGPSSERKLGRTVKSGTRFHLRSQRLLRSSSKRVLVLRDDWFGRLVRSLKGDYLYIISPEWRTLLIPSGVARICAALGARECGQNWPFADWFTHWVIDFVCMFPICPANLTLSSQ